MNNDQPQPARQQELTPELALNTIYSALRQLKGTADEHDLLKSCTLKINEVIERDKQVNIKPMEELKVLK